MALLPHISDDFINAAKLQLQMITVALEGSGAFAHPFELTDSEKTRLKHVHNKLLHILTISGVCDMEYFTENYLLDGDIAQILFEAMNEPRKYLDKDKLYRTAKQACKCGICANCTLP
jgi:hypothetical protein